MCVCVSVFRLPRGKKGGVGWEGGKGDEERGWEVFFGKGWLEQAWKNRGMDIESYDGGVWGLNFFFGDGDYEWGK